MKAYKFSISKVLFDILSMLAGAIAIQLIIDFLFAPELFQNLKATTISISFFASMMLITYVAFTYAAPTIKFVKFENDHLHLNFIRGHKHKILAYNEIESITQKGFSPNNTKITVGDEKLRLLLQLFTKKDRAEIVKTLIDKTSGI